MKNTIIIKVTLAEVEQLKKIGKQTFLESFSSGNTEENMKEYLEKAFSNEQLIAELSDNNSEFHFALIDNKEIGYLKINWGESQTEIKGENALEIERIYVQKEYQGKRVGQLLYNKAFDIAKQNNVNYIWLGVWEKNPRAIRFYKKNGFSEFDKHIFKLGEDNQTDIMMRLQLK